jgi:hypothetical protein
MALTGAVIALIWATMAPVRAIIARTWATDAHLRAVTALAGAAAARRSRKAHRSSGNGRAAQTSFKRWPSLSRLVRR